MFGSVLASQAKVTWAAWTFEGGREKRIKAAKKRRWKILKCSFMAIKKSTFPKPICNPTKIMLIRPWSEQSHAVVFLPGPLANPLAAGEITSPISPQMINWILEFGESQPYPNQDSVIFFKQPRDKP